MPFLKSVQDEILIWIIESFCVCVCNILFIQRDIYMYHMYKISLRKS